MGDLVIQNLTKRFNNDSETEIVAVDDVSIEIEDGEFLVLVGPSGCGKSTTLRCTAGLESVTEGTITLSGRDITHQRSRDRDIAMVFQNYALYPHMSSRKNMGFGLKMGTDMESDEIEERIEQTASMMGIEELLEKKPGELSGGQQQRVALGRAIVRDPELFLMDEPLSNLDAKLRTTMRTELQNLQSDLGVTTIYVTHDQTEAMTMGDRIAVLDGGKLQQIGTPLECYHLPANRFVAGFIGSPSMNFFEVKQDRDAGALVHDEFEYHLKPATADTIANSTDDLTLGIRPEDIRIAGTNDENALTVTVDVVEPLGDESFVYFTVGDQTCTASVDGEEYIKEDSQIDVVFPQDRIHVFDGHTGEAIKNRQPPEAAEAEADEFQNTSSFAAGQSDD
ncbi:sugar ABC transporter ATP-binding protein [Halogeometricum pallidum JCM 14848]|uniref:ABC-type D-xylose/L-arabinose transporter n=1 Tax=Halogeometricum pallidum JCM 14848 TaxID=1227487 RepID=M0DAX3_HALPD|nr:sn-glycerol-3-phosphate ABC transporter ATP-binding protein UgpC [Halogeometricum pallidum]ELZ32635.1 sugar ABC transporter ATP-binding protein [Halogeometricum pallidum JCM 14848]